MYLIIYYQINLLVSNLYNTFANVNNNKLNTLDYEQKTNNGCNRTCNNSD